MNQSKAARQEADQETNKVLTDHLTSTTAANSGSSQLIHARCFTSELLVG